MVPGEAKRSLRAEAGGRKSNEAAPAELDPRTLNLSPLLLDGRPISWLFYIRRLLPRRVGEKQPVLKAGRRHHLGLEIAATAKA